MRALILNSGRGSRMGPLTSQQPKCLTTLSAQETILSRQLRLLAEAGVQDVVVTTGYLKEQVETGCRASGFPGRITFVHNPDYETTNYIYSICLAKDLLDDDILLLHGDLVFEPQALDSLLSR